MRATMTTMIRSLLRESYGPIESWTDLKARCVAQSKLLGLLYLAWFIIITAVLVITLLMHWTMP